MTWQAYSVDTLTGVVQDAIPVSSFGWDRALSAGRSMTCTIPLDGLDYSKTDLRALTAHWGRTIVLEHDSKVVAAGLVRNRGYRDRVLTLNLVDLWGLWARRGAWGDVPRPANQELWSISYTNTTLGTLAKRAVQRGTAAFSAPFLLPEPSLPITLPSDVSGDLSRTYYGYHFEFVADVLDDLMVEGLDIDFRPRWVDGALDWEMRTDPAEYTWEWSVTAAKAGVAGFREESDGSRMVNNAYLIGEGSERDMLVRSNRDVASVLPLMDRLESRKFVTSTTQAAAMANQLLDQYELPTDSWSFEVMASGDPDAGVPPVGDLRLGDTVRLGFFGDLWVEDGFHERRIVRLDGSLGERVTVTLQPTGGA